MAKSFEGLKAASEVAKQIITLSTGVITVTVSFFDKIQGPHPTGLVHGLVVGSWIAFIVAIIAAIVTLQGATASLDHLDQIENGQKTASAKLPSAYDGGVRWPGAVMILAFAVAMSLTTFAGISR